MKFLSTKSIISVIVVLILSVVNVFAQTIEDKLAEASSNFAKGNYEKALEGFKDVFFSTYAPYPAIVLGDMYMQGQGTEVNYHAAIDFYKSVADIQTTVKDDLELRIMVAYACRNCALLTMIEKDAYNDSVIIFFNKAHELTGDAMSEYLLGLYYENDKEDLDKAIYFYDQSQSKDCICAIEHLAQLYEEEDPDMAFSLHLRAANINIMANEDIDNLYSPLTNPNLSNPLVEESRNRALANVAVHLGNQGDASEALEYLLRLTEMTAERYVQRGLCYATLGQKEKALRDFESSLQMEETGLAYNTYAICYEKMWNDNAKAEYYYKKAIAMGFERAKINYANFLKNR